MADDVVAIDAETCFRRGFESHHAGAWTAAETWYRAALRQRPDFPAAWVNLGLIRLAAGEVEEAAQYQREALRLDPACADAQNALGLAHYRSGRVSEAENCFRGCLRLAPAHADALTNLAVALQALGWPAQAEAAYRQALAAGADAARVHNNLSVLLREQGRLAEAEAAVREALRLAPEMPDAQVNLAMALLATGRWIEAWDYYEARWQVADLAATRRRFAQPLWQGEAAIAGRTILLHAEQGFGDTLQFCRYVPAVAALGARVVLQVQRPLLRLLASLDGVATLLADDEALPEFDWHCPLMSLPRAFRQAVPVGQVDARPPPAGWGGEVDQGWGEGDSPPDCAAGPLPPIPSREGRGSPGSFSGRRHSGTSAPSRHGQGSQGGWRVPYLRADPDRSAAWAGVLAPLPGRRIGLVWAGSSRAWLPHAVAIDRRRSMRLADMAPLAAVPGVSFVSLQLGPPAAQLHEPPAGLVVHDVAAGLGDFADTAALIAALDLVITVDTAVVHLAGALGRPVWLLNRFDACWRWLRGRDDSPWYPSLRQFRRGAEESWRDVMARVAAALCA